MNLKAYIFVFSILYLIGFKGHASVLGRIPGIVPRDDSGTIATDLVDDNGQNLTIPEALEIRKKGTPLDLLSIAPSDLWGPKKFNIPFTQLKIDRLERVDYVGTVESPAGMMRFMAKREVPGLGAETLTFIISKDSHNLLMRKALLEKIGYTVPPALRSERLELNFENEQDRNTFIEAIEAATGNKHGAWVLDKQETKLLLQDLVVTDNSDLIYNLALGFISSDIIEGRRVFNSLLVPFALTNIPESVNLFSWHGTQIISNAVKFDYPYRDDFTPSWDDIRWIGRLLGKLEKRDWLEVARAGAFPLEVEYLVGQKLIARRNQMCIHLHVPCLKMEFDPKVSFGKYLKDGKILAKKFPGHAPEYSLDLPENPLSKKEVFAFTKSRAASLLLSNFMAQFNKYVMPRNDMDAQFHDFKQKLVTQKFDEFLRTGKMTSGKIGFFALPTYGLNLVASRDVITGTYLGTDNMIQLADSIGFSMNTGAYIGTYDVPIPIGLSGGGNVFLTRTFTHIRPIKSVKKALKEPVKNIFVNELRRSLGVKLDKIVLNPRFLKLSKEQQEKRIALILTEFYKKIEIGESLIITDSLGAGINIQANYNFNEYLKAGLRFSEQQMALGRVHILRRNADTFHVYDDTGGQVSLGLSFGLNAVIPVLNVEGKTVNGRAKTKFYNLNLKPNFEENPDLLKNLRALRMLLVDNTKELLEATNPPYVISHGMTDNRLNVSLLQFRHTTQAFKDYITIQHPQGDKRYFYRDTYGVREGNDWLGLGTESVNGILNTFTQSDTSVTTPSSGNPGDTTFGNAETKQTHFEGEFIPAKDKKKKGSFKSYFVGITTQIKGWTIKRAKAEKKIEEMSRWHGLKLYPPAFLNNTTKIQLYSIWFNIYLYDEAIKAMSTASDQLLRATWLRQGRNMPIGESNEMTIKRFQISSREINQFKRYQKKFKESCREGDVSNCGHYAKKMAMTAEKYLYLKGIAYLSGGTNHLFVETRFQGFREGDEEGDTAFIGDSFGEFGARETRGPIQSIKNLIGMSDAEFFISWLVVPL